MHTVLHVYMYISIYVYMYVCVCVCVYIVEITAVLHHNPTSARTQTTSSPGKVGGVAPGGWGVDSFDFDLVVLEEVCRELGVRLVVVPFDVLNTQNHQILLEWIWHNEVFELLYLLFLLFLFTFFTFTTYLRYSAAYFYVTLLTLLILRDILIFTH
jgi:hypothetical protein